MSMSLRVALLVLVFPGATAAGATLADVAWLTGCWASADAEPGSGEQWMAPAGGTMLGMGRQVRDGRTVSHEWLGIIETDHGSLAYVAWPAGQAETRFELSDSGDGYAQFDNPDHDFPQRVSYRLRGDRLEARIEGRIQVRERTIEFPMQRASCVP